MTVVKSDSSTDGVCFRCPSHKGQKLSIRSGSFLSHHHVTLKNFVLLAYFWAYEMPNCTAAEMLGLHPNTVVQWFSYLRDAASNHLLRNPMQIGGPGRIVEIDESVIARRKYHRGHRVPERWAFGGIDPESNLGFWCL